MARYRDTKKGKTSKYRGVFCIYTNKQGQSTWRASCDLEYLGSFRSEKEAALAYNEAARQIFGKNAYQNVIEE